MFACCAIAERGLFINNVNKTFMPQLKLCCHCIALARKFQQPFADGQLVFMLGHVPIPSD